MISSEQEFSNSYERLYQCPLSHDEKKEAENNLYGFLNLLIEIDQASNK